MGAAPLWFECPVAKRIYSRDPRVQAQMRSLHEVVRTGRVKPRPHTGSRGYRTLDTMHEFRCTCGHVGWSSHIDMLRVPVG